MTKLRPLPVLEERRAALETCAFCPKLCRSMCPVSDAESSESVTPWGKMSSVYAVARGAKPTTADYAALSWACTGCLGCRERCEQRNPVADTLYAARSHYFIEGAAPAAAERLSQRFELRLAQIESQISALRREHGHDEHAPTALLLGCSYVARLPRESDDGIRAAKALFGSLRLLSGCCGLSLDEAGDSEQATQVRAALLQGAKGARRLVVVDAGCAYALRAYGSVPLARAALPRLQKLTPAAVNRGAPLRYHDPCLLGRGLGEYDAPRQLLTLAAGQPPEEFTRSREFGRCSGGGGLLPLTRPETAARIARDRVSEHRELGGGRIVTACAESLRRFRAEGADAIDLATIVRQLAER